MNGRARRPEIRVDSADVRLTDLSGYGGHEPELDFVVDDLAVPRPPGEGPRFRA